MISRLLKFADSFVFVSIIAGLAYSSPAIKDWWFATTPLAAVGALLLSILGLFMVSEYAKGRIFG